MAKGISLHIGLNRIDPAHYAGWSGPLIACEADAQDMQLIARSQGFSSSTLLTAGATRKAVLDGIAGAADSLANGDTFLLTMAAHGSQVPDLNGDEADIHDETWCLYDGQLIDDELSLALADFARGVRVLVVSDTCHSGTVVRTASMRAVYGDLLSVQAAAASRAMGERSDGLALMPAEPLPRVIPADLMSRTYLANKAFYDELQSRDGVRGARNRVAASVILLSACQDNQTAMDGSFNGAFTGHLKRVWNGSSYAHNYDRFIADIRRSLDDPMQSPGIFRIGEPNPDFDAQTPFRIE
ncbi:caspase family protein [Sphingomonas koreensis]